MQEYFSIDSQMPSYMIFPRFLMEMELNDTARMVYVLLLDRSRVSQKNEGWSDETGAVFVVYPIAHLAGELHRSEMTIKTALAALEKAGLVRRKRMGVGRPNRLYLRFPADNIPAVGRKENGLPYGKDSVYPEDRNLSTNENNKSKNEKIKNKREEERTAYGEYQNVFLSDAELKDLQKTVPDWHVYIERLSEYMASTGKRYQNHAATIKSWARQDRKRAQPKKPAYSHEMYTFEEGESL